MGLTEDELRAAVQDLNARIERSSEAIGVRWANQGAGALGLTADIDDADVVTVASPEGPIFSCSLQAFERLRAGRGSGRQGSGIE